MTLSMGADKDIPGQLGKHLTFKCCGFKRNFNYQLLGISNTANLKLITITNYHDNIAG